MLSSRSKSKLKCEYCKNGYFQNKYRNISSVYSREKLLKYSIQFCNNCKIGRTYPAPTEDTLKKIYQKEYAYNLHNLVQNEKRMRSVGVLRLLKKWDASQAILEIGCGEGIFVEMATKKGYQTKGYDFDFDSVTKGNYELAKIGIYNALFHGTASEAIESKKRVTEDVFMSHTLEHVLDLNSFLKSLSSKTNPGHKLFIVVPNTLNRFRHRRNKYWGYWQVPVHVTHFDRDSLNHLLKVYDYELKYSTTRSGDFLSKGLLFANLFKVKSSDVPKNNFLALILPTASRLWGCLYFWGSADLISCFVKKKQNA